MSGIIPLVILFSVDVEAGYCTANAEGHLVMKGQEVLFSKALMCPVLMSDHIKLLIILKSHHNIIAHRVVNHSDYHIQGSILLGNPVFWHSCRNYYLMMWLCAIMRSCTQTDLGL